MSTATSQTRATPIQVAGRAAAPVGGLWDRLAHPAPPAARFDPSTLTGLPEAARRWLAHAIAPGTPMYRAVLLEMEGHIRLGRWLPFRAVQVHAPPDGYVWAARTRLGPLSITGYDRYADGVGQMRWRLLGRVPVVNATGPDLDHSAAGRVALDACFVPTALLTLPVTWRAGSNADTAIAEWTVGDHTLRPELHVGADGALRSVAMARWAKPSGHPWGEYPCGGSLHDEADFGGIKLPTRMRVGYFFGTAHAFLSQIRTFCARLRTPATAEVVVPEPPRTALAPGRDRARADAVGEFSLGMRRPGGSYATRLGHPAGQRPNRGSLRFVSRARAGPSPLHERQAPDSTATPSERPPITRKRCLTRSPRPEPHANVSHGELPERPGSSRVALGCARVLLERRPKAQ